MKNVNSSMRCLAMSSVVALATVLFSGCKSTCCTKPMDSDAGTPAAAAKSAEPRVALPTVRIDAASTAPFTDSAGNVWLADTGFDGGDTIDRPEDMAIANTKDAAIYRTERYSMAGFSYALPNGKYIVKLHFCETFEGIGGPGQRVFSFNVEGKEFKDFDVWAKAGGPQKAYIESVPVDITDGKLDITFTSNIENPEINGIEIIPAS